MSDLKTKLLMVGDDLVVDYTQDISGILDSNKEKQADGFSGYTDTSREMKQVAFIPDIVLIEFMNKGVNFFTKEGREYFVKHVLNNPEYAHLRTSGGRV